jgi:hypothetical protein
VTASLVVCTASNSDSVLAENLALSPMIGQGTPLHVERDAPSAAIAYNRALEATDAELVVFAHQDVYLPVGWDSLLRRKLDEIDRVDPAWALAGAYGIGIAGRGFGPVWTSSLGRIVGEVPLAPVEVQSFDEMLIVLRRSSGLRFDEELPGWHMYGTDIVCRARAAGLHAYAPGLPCIHNDRFKAELGADFEVSYRWMQTRWASMLPLQTPVTKVARYGLARMRERRNLRRSVESRARRAVDTSTGARELARACGWESLVLESQPV